MPTRRAHQKSRNGCATCKRRHVKCDEEGPPCGPCHRKAIECVFPEVKRASSVLPRSDGSSSATATPPISQPNRSIATVSPSPFDRTQELDLMLQWTTSTYKSMCGEYTADYPTWQIIIPRLALKHEYLLSIIFATSSLEMVMTSEGNYSSSLLNSALEYQDVAYKSFRTLVSGVTESNHFAVFSFSLLTMILSLAIPQCERSSMVESIVFQYQLLKGIGFLTLGSMEWLKDGPFKAHMRWPHEVSVDTLDSDTKEALARLNEVNETVNNAAAKSSRASKFQAMSSHAACMKAIFHLEEIFARCLEPKWRGVGLAWINFAGDEYVKAVKDLDPVALLVLMHWGVLAHRTKQDLWWLDAAGKSLIEEVTSIMPPSDEPLVNVCIAWARQEVGLDVVTAALDDQLALA